jgi:methionine sulfoxide reductase heme-binding subunit
MSFKNNYVWVGMMLFGIFVLQYMLGWQWALLQRWQTNATYKAITGFLLATYIGFQWLLYFFRKQPQRSNEQKRQAYQLHKWIGALSPLFFWMHSVKLGYAYLLILSVLYFANFGLGLMNVEAIAARSKWYLQVWLVAHLTFSTLIVFLTMHHIWVSFYFH